LREGGRGLAQILQKIIEAVKPGISTYELDRLAESLIFEFGGVSSFKGYRAKKIKAPYPASLCISINDEVVHGVPRKDRILRGGDIIGLDIGMKWPRKGGLYTDMAVTIGVGKISPEAERLIRLTKEALDIGVATIRQGVHIGDISHVIQKHFEKHKLGIVRDLAGHGVGYKVHEEPLIPNFGQAGTGPILKEGMVLALEPMATLGDWRITLKDDGWTFKTADNSLAAHFEHTIVVIAAGARVLTQT